MQDAIPRYRIKSPYKHGKERDVFEVKGEVKYSPINKTDELLNFRNHKLGYPVKKVTQKSLGILYITDNPLSR